MPSFFGVERCVFIEDLRFWCGLGVDKGKRFDKFRLATAVDACT